MPIFEPETEVQETAPIKTVTQYATDPETIKPIMDLEGSNWEITYYQQYLDNDDLSRPFDSAIDPTVQQYIRINDLVGLLQGDLSSAFAESDNTLSLTGELVLYPGLVPNANDHFVATSPDGLIGLFICKTPKRYTYRRGTSYTVEFELFREHSTAIQIELDKRVVLEQYFNRDTKLLGETPREITNIRNVNISKLVIMMYQKFFDKDTNTFCYPDDMLKVYDPFYTEFISQLIPAKLRGNKPRPTVYSCDNGEYRKPFTTIWDILIRGTDIMFGPETMQVELVSPIEFSSDNVLYNISSSFVDRVIYPKEIQTLRTTAKPVDPDGEYYVFTKAFYEGDTENMDEMETIISDYLKGTRPLLSCVNTFISTDVPIRTDEELFYRLTLYYYLIKIAIKD